MKYPLKTPFLLVVLLILQSIVPPGSVFSDEAEDSYERLHHEEIQAKQTRVEEYTNRIVVIQKQLELDRKSVGSSQQKLWSDFTEGMEIDRKNLQERLSTLDEKQKLFERELDRKRQEDEVKMKEKEAEIQRTLNQMEGLKREIEDSKKLLEARRLELESQQEASSDRVKLKENSSLNLPDQSIKVSEKGSDAREISRHALQSEYFVEIGDTLGIEVWRVSDLSRDVTVRPDGRISMPVVGDLDVVGLSLMQLRDLLTKKFAEYVWNPQVSISIRTFGGRKFIILGEVGGPGVYRYQQDVSLMEAIALAGGFRDTAKRGKVMIIRGDVRHETQVKIITANVMNILKKGMLTENLNIMPNDIIYVTKDLLADYRDVINDLVAPTLGTPTSFFVLRSAVVAAKDRRF